MFSIFILTSLHKIPVIGVLTVFNPSKEENPIIKERGKTVRLPITKLVSWKTQLNER